MAILSGKDFSMLKRFQTEWPRVHARTSYVKSADMNGDGVGDVVTAAQALVVEKPWQCAMVFSARDGKLLATLHPGSGQGRLMPSGTQMAPLKSAGPHGRPGLAVAGYTPDGVAAVTVVIFVFPRLSSR
jgi:hypothetical protein